MLLTLEVNKPYANERYHAVHYGNGRRAQKVDMLNGRCNVDPPTGSWAWFVMFYATIDEKVCTFLGQAEFGVSREATVFNGHGIEEGTARISGDFKPSLKPFLSTGLRNRLIEADTKVYTGGDIEYDKRLQVFYQLETVHSDVPMVALPSASSRRP